ncbi:MAG: hypothetical protein HY895_15800 [Deltaproteobacteria bacterium]|nr:hypothetical protein [Deltaproteobacteria bacterium]
MAVITRLFTSLAFLAGGSQTLVLSTVAARMAFSRASSRFAISFPRFSTSSAYGNRVQRDRCLMKKDLQESGLKPCRNITNGITGIAASGFGDSMNNFANATGKNALAAMIKSAAAWWLSIF